MPVCVAIGMVGLSMSFGLYTAMQHLKYSPDVQVRKSRRETIPELADPDRVLEESEKLIKNSFFRKIAHIQDFNHQYTVPDPIHGDAFAHMYVYIYIYIYIYGKCKLTSFCPMSF